MARRSDRIEQTPYGRASWRFGADCLWLPGIYPAFAWVSWLKRRVDTLGVLVLDLDAPAVLGRIAIIHDGCEGNEPPLCVLQDNLYCRRKRWSLPPSVTRAAACGESLVLTALIPVWPKVWPEPAGEPVQRSEYFSEDT